MHLNKALPDAEILFHDYVEWVQLIDYEHVPFRFKRCHALGHLFRDCPLSQKPSFPAGPDMPKADGFTKVSSRRRSHKKSTSNSKMPQPSPSKPSTRRREITRETKEREGGREGGGKKRGGGRG